MIKKRLTEEEATNYEVCAKCGGECCKKGGCDCLPTDFENLKYDYLISKLEEGYFSVVSSMKPTIIKGKVVPGAFLYIRAREVGKGVIDLFSLRRACANHTETGCPLPFEQRPAGGINLIPASKYEDCHPKEDIAKLVDTWGPHQNVLRRIVKRYTGRSPEDVLREDYYKFFKAVLQGNFNGVHPIEIQEVKFATPALALAFPDEFNRAYNEVFLGPRNFTSR